MDDVFEWCVQFFSSEDTNTVPLYHIHMDAPTDSGKEVTGNAALQAIEDNVSLKDAAFVMVTCICAVEPVAAAMQDTLRAERHGGKPAVDPNPPEAGHRLH